MAVLAAPISRVDAVSTMATLSAFGPNWPPSSNRNRSGLTVAALSSAVSNAVMSGEVMRMPAITSSIARRAV